MSQVKYQVTLSLNGNHQVSVAADDPVAVKEALVWAKAVYDQLKERAGTSLAMPSPASNVYHHDITPPEPAPICAIHKQPMVRMNGRRGEFWSCHEKLDDGSYCPYRPPK